MDLSDEHLFRSSLHNLQSVRSFLFLLAAIFGGSLARGEVSSQLKGHRFLTLNTVVRIQQIEVTRDTRHGEDESSVHSPAEARIFREAIEKAWPGAKLITQGEFGLLWREHFKNNDALDYRFVQSGSGIRASQEKLKIRWFMNRDFRLALLAGETGWETEKVIDFTRYDLPAQEPADPEPGKHSRNWSLMNRINQKGTRPQDQPVPLSALAVEDRALIRKHYPELLPAEGAGR